MEIYKSEQPPRYPVENLKNIKFDVFITISDGDPYCIEKDYDEMYKYMTSAKIYKKHVNKYNHVDYLWSKTAYLDIYEDIYTFLLD